MPETKATVRYLRTSAYKVREVLSLIRGLPVEEARHVLRFCQRAAADDVLKALNSAAANAENTLNLPADELYVSLASADEGPTIKRWRPRARGRATRIRKRTSHMTIVVARLSDAQLEALRQREAAQAGGRRRGVLPRRRRSQEKAPAAAQPETEAPSPAEAEEPQEASSPAAEAEETEAGEDDAEDMETRYATLGREEEPAAEAEGHEDEEEEGSS